MVDVGRLEERPLGVMVPHDLRRTAVRNLERAGVPRSTAMEMVGHKTESIYRRYAIQDEASLREGAERLTALHQAQDDARPSARGHGLGTVGSGEPSSDQRN
jgi:hypothetical protein